MNSKQKILIIDDEESICWGIQQVAKGLQLDSVVASSAEEGLAFDFDSGPDLIISDIRLPGIDGLSAMEKMRQRWPEAPIVIITAFGDLETAVSAVRKGAFEYVVKPFDAAQIKGVIEKGLAYRQRSQVVLANTDQPSIAGFVAVSPQMQLVFNQIALAANSDASVLICGESGTGKELAARAIHQFSRRAEAPYVVIHLAALAPELIESELFGHQKGAFTGAERNRTGLLMQANGGTVFLDEVAEIPLPLQVKLLRVLDQKEISPVGSNELIECNFRVLAATHRNLKQLVAEGKFRQDLYFRLAAFAVELPPLRDRKEDIMPLARHFLAKAQTNQERRCSISAEATEVLLKHPWIGNIRELRNAIEHAIIVSRGQSILPEHLPTPVQFQTGQVFPGDNDDLVSSLSEGIKEWARKQLGSSGTDKPLYDLFIENFEPALLGAVLKETQGNVSVASQILGLHRTTLKRKLDQYEISESNRGGENG